MKANSGSVLLRLVLCCVSVVLGSGAGFGQIVITEIIQNPSAVGDSAGEWFELHNAGSSAVDINGWKIKDDSTTSETHTITNQGGLSIPAGGYIVLALNGDSNANGGVTAAYDYSSISLGNGTDGLVLTDGSDVEQDRVVWDNGSTFPDPNGASMALVTDMNGNHLDNSVGANWCESQNAWPGSAGDKGTPGAANDCPVRKPPPPPLTGEIWEIQGSGSTSSQNGGMATTNDNVVTAVLSSGFFMQTPASRSDGDVDTSDGIFVVYGGAPTVMAGDQVDVVGLVQDGPGAPAYEFTSIDATVDGGSVTIDASNQPLPAPVAFDRTRPSPNPASPSCAVEMECYEGMRVRIVTGTVAAGAQYRSSDNTAETRIVPGDSRPFREPGIAWPGVEGIPVWDGNPEVFEMDPDELGLTNVSWTPGTNFTAIGVLAYSFGDYELYPTQLTLLGSGPALPRPVRAKTDGEITVASQNLLNLRGGASATKLGKLSRFIREVLLSPDVVAVQEVYGLAALQALATQVQTDDARVTYTAHVPAPGTSSQAVGFLTRSGVTVNSVTEHGRGETFVDPRDNTNDPLHDRPPIVLDATVGDFSFSVIGIHNRSLSDVDSPTRGEWVRTKRLEQAQSVARLVESMQDSKVVVVGDYNGYQFSDGYVDVVGQMRGVVDQTANLMSGPDLVSKDLCNLVDRLPADDRYSFVFGGNAQALDHALVNQALERHVVEMQYARGNADAAGKDQGDATSALGASDHDGLVVYLSPTAKPPVSPSPCQGASVAPPPTPGPGDGGPGDGGPGDGGPGGGVGSTADLSLEASSRVVSGTRTLLRVEVENQGPATATNVVVTSSLAASGASLDIATAGCAEDPDGVPNCALGDIEAGSSASFSITVDTAARSEGTLRYSGAVASDVTDPTSGNDEDRLALPLGPPASPTDLVATARSGTEIELRWKDNSSTETGFAVYLQGPGDSKLRLIGTAPANSTSTVVRDLVPNVTYRFAVEARNGALLSERTPKAAATTWTVETAHCGEGDYLCLGRFQVEVDWEDAEGRTGRGTAERLTARSGDFWFFDPANIELVVKVLDGCSINGHYWVYAVGLTDVAVRMTVRDLHAGSPFAGVATSIAEKTWTTALGDRFDPISDLEAFATCGPLAAASAAASDDRNVLSGAPLGTFDRSRGGGHGSGSRGAPIGSDRLAAAAACTEDDGSLCLQDGRYDVRANWRVGEETGAATGVPRTADTGMFWFFSPDNVELVVKVLDGCALNGHRWVLMGGLTDVGVEVVVRDAISDTEAKAYRSPEGSPFATMFDVTAFPCVAGR